MNDTAEQSVELDLGASGGSKIQLKLSEIDPWLATERQFWSWLQPVAQQDNMAQGVRSKVFGVLDSLGQILTQIKSTPVGSAQFLQRWTNLQQKLTEAYVNGSTAILHSSVPRSQYVATLAATRPAIAAQVLANFLRLPIGTATANILRGAAEATLYELGITGWTDAQRAVLENLRKEWAEKLTHYQKTADESTSKVKELLGQVNGLRAELGDAYKKISAEQAEAHATQLESQSNGFAAVLAEAKKELTQITQTYDDKLSLQAPVAYWTDKKRSHSRWTLIFGLSSLTVMVGSPFGAWIGLHDVLRRLGADGRPPYWEIAGLVITATFVIWLVRIITRIFLSNLHLRTDADERITMVNTYLALLRNQQGLSENDRRLIIEALFRPVTSGLIKDDGVPTTALTLLADRIVGGKP